MRFFKSLKADNGLAYSARVRYSDLAQGWIVDVDVKYPDQNWMSDWWGKENGGYDSEEAALKALYRHYPDVEWYEWGI